MKSSLPRAVRSSAVSTLRSHLASSNQIRGHVLIGVPASTYISSNAVCFSCVDCTAYWNSSARCRKSCICIHACTWIHICSYAAPLGVFQPCSSMHYCMRANAPAPLFSPYLKSSCTENLPEDGRYRAISVPSVYRNPFSDR